MAPHSSTLAWQIPWMEEPGRLQSMGSEKSDMTERLPLPFSLSCIGEGNGNPLQCSFFFFFFNFTIIVLVLPYINMHLPQVYICSPS